METPPDASKTLWRIATLTIFAIPFPPWEAQRQTKEEDEVLASGGFKVKGWVSNRDHRETRSSKSTTYQFTREQC